jgi:HEAT repeat protein
MGELLVMAMVAGAIAVGAWVLAGQRSVRRTAWRQAALCCGLADIDVTQVLTGRAGRLLVRLEPGQPEMQELPRTRITIDGRADDLVEMSVQAAGRATAFQRKTALKTGDPDFDARIVVSGPSLQVEAVLDEETRGSIRELIEQLDLEVAFGMLRALVPEAAGLDRRGLDLVDGLRRLLDLCRRLRRKTDLPAALAHSASGDRVATVRERRLATLLQAFPDHTVTRETLRAATGDPSDAVRVRAGIALGQAGRPTLLEVARREGADDRPAAEAVLALGQALTLPETQEILRGALRARRIETALACLRAIAGRREPEALTTLARVMAVAHEDVAAAAARALGEMRLPAAEGPLLEALRRDDAELRLAAADALARLGTARAVLPLQEAEAAHSHDQDFRRAARHAVAEIQSRLHGASAGQLSLASPGPEVGELSLAEDAQGRLSLETTEDRGPGGDVVRRRIP